MPYTTVTDDAAEIRKQYKAKGWNSRQISVRSEYFSGGSAINVTIKDGAIPLPLAKRIAEGKERIHRCEITGEILAGSNRYVDVRLTDGARATKAAPYILAVDTAVAKLDPAARHILQPIGNTGYFVGLTDHSTLSLWGDTSHISSWMSDGNDVALELALAIERSNT